MIFCFSDDERYAYRQGCGLRGFWLGRIELSVEELEARCKTSPFLAGVAFKHPTEPREYAREKLDFTFWKVRRRAKKDVDLPAEDLFVQDYLLHEAWLDEQRNRA